MPSPPPPRIGIIGAGPGGLTLARLLNRANVPFTIYDWENGPSERNQGGTLDLHLKSGQRALKAAGLFEEFRRRSRPEGDALKMVNFKGEVLFHEERPGDSVNDDVQPGAVGDRQEIDRLELRDMLLSSVGQEAVRWGQRLEKIEAHPPPQAEGDGRQKFSLHFTSSPALSSAELGSSDLSMDTGFDLIIGADGARSRVRPLLTSVNPHHSGIMMVELWALDVDACNPWLSSYVGRGSYYMFDASRAIIAQRNGNGSVRVYACVEKPHSWFDDCGIEWSDPQKARQQLVEGYFNDCGEDVKRLIIDAKDELVLRRLDMLPVGIKWPHRAGVTLLGDAAHLMTPFAGEGVNLAMHDALDLANAIAEGFGMGVQGLDKAVEKYEEGMWERAREKAALTWSSLKDCFSEDGGEKVLRRMGPPEGGDEGLSGE